MGRMVCGRRAGVVYAVIEGRGGDVMRGGMLAAHGSSWRVLDGGERDMQVRLHGFGEKSPGVLQIRNRHHGYDAGHELDPAVGNTGRMN